MTSHGAEMMGRNNQGRQKCMHFLGAHAELQLRGQLLQCDLRQRFFNPPDRGNVEITYTCPLPYGAVLLGVDVVLDDKRLKGEVKAREAARDQYEEAIDKGDSAFLVAVNPDGSISMELGNLMAGESCEITLRYAQVLQVAQGSLRLMLPTTIAPRYGDAVKDGRFEPHSAPHASPSVEYPFTVDVRIEGELARARISSPSHPLGMRAVDGAVLFTLASAAWLDRDLVLMLEDLPAAGVAVVAPDVLEPQESVVLACLAPQMAEAESHPVTVQLLVDCSGSMGGSSIASARMALQQIVNQLQPRDQFSLSRFGTSVRHCHRRLVSMTPEQRVLASEWVSELDADMGGTEMEAAIVSTLQITRGKASDLLLVTDGDIHAVDSLIARLRGQSHRCFIVGIGSSPSETHLRRMAEATGGACEFVAPGEAVQGTIERMFARLRSVRITQLALQLPPQVEVMAVESLPDFAFMGDQIQAFIRIQGSWPQGVALQLNGCVNGVETAAKALSHCVPTLIADAENTLARMAAHAVCAQSRRGGATGGTGRDLGITDLAVRYQLVTEHTHFVLSHERAAGSEATATPMLVTTPNMLAGGSVVRLAGSEVLEAGVPDMQMAASAVHFYRPSGARGRDNRAFPSVWRASRSNAQGLFKTPKELASVLRNQNSRDLLARFDQLCKLGLPEDLVDAFDQLPDEADSVQALIRWLLRLEQAHWRIDSILLAQARQMGLGDWVERLTADRWPTLDGDRDEELEIPAFLRKQGD